MNIGVVVQAIEFAVEHRREIASDAEAAIHFLRRVEHICVHHKTTADKILVEADKMLGSVARSAK